MDSDTLKLITEDFKYCGYKVCGRPHWTGQGLFSKPSGGADWHNPTKVYCDVVCYAKDIIYQEIGIFSEVVFNG